MTIAPADFVSIRDFVEARAGIVLEPGKEYLAETRLNPIVDKLGLGSLAELARRVRGNDSALQAKVVEALTTNETSFFRDTAPFNALRQRVLPAIAARPAGERRLRIWSAACSTGQEAYSLAMMIREEFPALAADTRIIGTDINAAVVDKAKSGKFTQLDVNRGLPATLLVRYFHRQGMDWVIQDTVRAMTEFRVTNLVEPLGGLSGFDLVLLRNVMIYFSAETKARLMARVRLTMRRDGWLMVGASESNSVPLDLFLAETAGAVPLFRPKP